MENNIQEVLISQAQIEERVSQLARELSREYAGKNPVFVGVLKGVVMFFADMVKRITVPCQIDFCPPAVIIEGRVRKFYGWTGVLFL